MKPPRVCLQLGFGRGQAFQQTRRNWQRDPERATRLDFIAITPQPQALATPWPPMTRNLHRLAFDDGRVHLLLAVGHPLDVLPELRALVDEFLIDEFDASADPQRAPARLAKGLARLAAPSARLCAPPALHAALASAGFEATDAGPLAGSHSIDARATLVAFLTSVLHGQVSVAVRLVPIGQSHGLEIMAAMEPEVAKLADLCLHAALDDIGSVAYGADIAQMKHETLRTRIFRS